MNYAHLKFPFFTFIFGSNQHICLWWICSCYLLINIFDYIFWISICWRGELFSCIITNLIYTWYRFILYERIGVIMKLLSDELNHLSGSIVGITSHIIWKCNSCGFNISTISNELSPNSRFNYPYEVSKVRKKLSLSRITSSICFVSIYEWYCFLGNLIIGHGMIPGILLWKFYDLLWIFCYSINSLILYGIYCVCLVLN